MKNLSPTHCPSVHETLQGVPRIPTIEGRKLKSSRLIGHVQTCRNVGSRCTEEGHRRRFSRNTREMIQADRRDRVARDSSRIFKDALFQCALSSRGVHRRFVANRESLLATCAYLYTNPWSSRSVFALRAIRRNPALWVLVVYCHFSAHANGTSWQLSFGM